MAQDEIVGQGESESTNDAAPSATPTEPDPGAVTIAYESRSETQVHGYYAWWTRGLWLDLDLSLYDKLFFFDITPASDGSLLARNGYPFAWEGLMERADSFNLPVIHVCTRVSSRRDD